MKKLALLPLAFFSSFAFADCASDVNLLAESEKLSPAVFDFNFYVHNYPDLLSAFGGNKRALEQHWMNNGICEGRQGSDGFYSVEYLEHYSDLRSAFGYNYGAATAHYLRNGLDEKRVGRICEPIPKSIYFLASGNQNFAIAKYANGTTKTVNGASFPIYCTDNPYSNMTQKVSFDAFPSDGFKAAGDHFGVILRLSASKNVNSGYYLGRGVNFFGDRGIFREYNALTRVTFGDPKNPNDLVNPYYDYRQRYEGSAGQVIFDGDQWPPYVFYETIMNGNSPYSVVFAASNTGAQSGYVTYNEKFINLGGWTDTVTKHPVTASGVNFFSICKQAISGGCVGPAAVEFRNISISWE